MGSDSGAFNESDRAEARQFMLTHRPFLRSICDVSDRRQIDRLLAFATDKDLDCLAYVVYLISRREIPMNRSDRNKIIEGKRYNRLLHFMKRPTDYDYFKTLERREKLHQLKKLGFALKLLLNPIFYRYTKPETAENQGVAQAERIQAELVNTVKK